MTKEANIQVRITKELKDKFDRKLQEDGLTQSDFLTSCVINYLGIETIPKEKIRDQKMGE